MRLRNMIFIGVADSTPLPLLVLLDSPADNWPLLITRLITSICPCLCECSVETNNSSNVTQTEL